MPVCETPQRGVPTIENNTLPGPKNVGGGGDHTRVYIADTRRGAQFSQGKENLIHGSGMTSDF
jgi:hypothetical protein